MNKGSILEPQNPQRTQKSNFLCGSARRLALPPLDQIVDPCEAGRANRPGEPLIRLSLVLLTGLFVLTSTGADGVLHGYTNTPFIPGQPWRVHDDTRPFPPMVTPAPDVQAPAPSDAIVLFDGSSMQAWRDTETWVVQDGAMIAGKKDIRTKELFGDMQLHVEWMTPLPVPGAKVSDRGNSGVFLLDQYEVQIFDTFRTNTIYADGMAGGIYGQHPPLVNASRAPGEWQTFDITLTAPCFSPTNTILGRVTVFHNGILVQKDTVLLGGTSHRSLPNVKPHPVPAPIRLQAHGSPVKFRNIWVRPIKR